MCIGGLPQPQHGLCEAGTAPDAQHDFALAGRCAYTFEAEVFLSLARAIELVAGPSSLYGAVQFRGILPLQDV